MSVNIHLVDMVEDIFNEKLNSFDQFKLRDVERDAQSEKLKTAAEVVERLKRIKPLKENINRGDFKSLEEKIKRILRA